LKRPIYLDHQATTPVDPEVLAAMLPYFGEVFGNPSSRSHSYGWEADEAIQNARESVAELMGASPDEILFTSGATESNNLAIKGAAAALRGKGNHIITVATEHHAVLDPCLSLRKAGYDVTVLPVESDGLLDLNRLQAALTDRTILVSVLWAQNEIGVVQPIEAIARMVRARGVALHTDAVQAIGYLPIDVEACGVDYLSISAHKIYGPKGVGALYCRRGGSTVTLVAQQEGGGQERGLRPGTLNVPGIVGLGVAARKVRKIRSQESVRVRALRDRLAERLIAGLTGIQINGSREHRLPNNLNISFDGVDGEALLSSLREIAVSNGSACGSAARKPSHVLTALGVADRMALASLRFGLGRSTTEAEIELAADHVIEVVTRLRGT
jgi:cysteine desulfurase